jgi:hypothetical protein
MKNGHTSQMALMANSEDESTHRAEALISSSSWYFQESEHLKGCFLSFVLVKTRMYAVLKNVDIHDNCQGETEISPSTGGFLANRPVEQFDAIADCFLLNVKSI